MTDILTTAATQPAPDPAAGGPRPRRHGTWWAAPSLVVAVVTLGVMVVCAIAPGVIAPQPPDAVDPLAPLLPPSAQHLFGTDQLGRDLLSRVVHGARPSLQVGMTAMLIALAIGAAIGLTAGWFGGWVDHIAMRVIDVMLAFPGLLLALAVVTVLGAGTVNVAFAVGLAGVPVFTRLIRAEVLRLRGRPYIDAAVAGGVRSWGIVRRHIVPNGSAPVLVLAALAVGTSILEASSLSFLGFGPTPPTSEWGALVAAGRDHIATAWWLTTFPGLAVAAAVLAVTRIGRAIERAGR